MRKTLFVLVLVGLALMGANLTEIKDTPIGQEAGTGDYKFDKEGNLIRPEGYRQWVYIGTPLTPNDMNDGKAAFPEFHNVYIHPADFKHWEKTGKFRDGTIIIKELVTVGSKQAVSGNGYFMGDFAGLEATIKDSKRFPKEPGNWAYFSFGHELPYANTAKAFPTNACNSCHQASAADDFVFTQYYPILSASKGGDGMIKSGASGAIIPKNLDTEGMQKAMSEQFADKTVPPTEKGMLINWLNSGYYKQWYGASTTHKSFGPHDDVRIFYNSIMEKSMKAGNKEHPVGASSVKEQHKEGKHYGWSVSVKVKKGKGADTWYWMETLDKTDLSQVVFSKIGEPACTGCHLRPGNKDLVLAGYPLK